MQQLTLSAVRMRRMNKLQNDNKTIGEVTPSVARMKLMNKVKNDKQTTGQLINFNV
jgi:hypothetical protein